ncbi:MAG: SIS domain-containing protein [Thaumarchaeota archaeon]|nr:MAG: SIS domain-containing protein [Nitrososphaerota archaeon]
MKSHPLQLTGSILTATMREVGEQPSKLRSFLPIPVERATSGSIFVGAGDSYAAALATFYLSGGKYLAFDPYAISTIPSVAAGRDVIFISISGRTNSNISAARKLRGLARKRIAITANRDSPLAEEVDDVILLPYESRARVAGTLSFTLALLASMKRWRRRRPPSQTTELPTYSETTRSTRSRSTAPPRSTRFSDIGLTQSSLKSSATWSSFPSKPRTL